MANIFVVDDEPTILELIKMTLEMDGHTVETACDGAEALDKLGVKRTVIDPLRPDLIILDIMMPRVDGYAALIELGKSPKTSAIPVIVLTAKSQMRDTVAFERNVAGFVTKPFDSNALLDKIRKILAS
ncbi:MAG: hypothetical protein CVU77_03575 [Elusimicrobia bacterium HGW-Elusimicrobia-1]|jgi:CheY-like chemotaxis protein|nr:MAG: hypothetical protein CVU77_03575 [Elusimicrobia bacterium HGW-Elusimicrobia-1]